jgi:hypothetical protein
MAALTVCAADLRLVYKAANERYQVAWKAEDAMRQKLLSARRRFLRVPHNVAARGAYVWLIQKMDVLNDATRAALIHRDAVYEKLLQATEKERDANG